MLRGVPNRMVIVVLSNGRVGRQNVHTIYQRSHDLVVCANQIHVATDEHESPGDFFRVLE